MGFAFLIHSPSAVEPYAKNSQNPLKIITNGTITMNGAYNQNIIIKYNIITMNGIFYGNSKPTYCFQYLWFILFCATVNAPQKAVTI